MGLIPTEGESPTVRCESLRISYLDPLSKTGERLTEDVFIDPRDSWCDGGDTLLVSAHALQSLQHALDRESKYAKGTTDTVDKCRHDYLRELHYLLEELKRLSDSNPQFAPEIKATLEKVGGVQEEGEGFGATLSPEDAECIAASVGPREAADKELVDQLQDAKLGTDDELTMRLLLKKLRDATQSLMKERDRLRKILGPLDGDSSKMIEALLAAAEGEGATLCDIVVGVQDAAKTEQGKQDVEDAATDHLRDKHARLAAQLAELEPKVERWRATLAEMEEREAKIWDLTEEVTATQALVDEKEAQGPQQPDDALLLKEAMESMSAAERQKVECAEENIASDRAEAAALNKRLFTLERDVQERHEEEMKCRQCIEGAAEELATLGERVRGAEERLHIAELEEERASELHEKVRSERMLAEDEYLASKGPPPRARDLQTLEEEVQQQRAKNADLREVEASVFEKEKLYEVRVEHTEWAWLALQEERAAEALNRKLEESEAQVSTKRRLVDDPDLMDYFERIELPQFAASSRWKNLHHDLRGKSKRLSEARQMQQQVTQAKFLDVLKAVKRPTQKAEPPAWMAEAFLPNPDNQDDRPTTAASTATGGTAISSRNDGAELSSVRRSCAASDIGTKPCTSLHEPRNPPVWFRRPEDLRVKLAGAERTTSRLSEALEERKPAEEEVVAELRGLGYLFRAQASESSRLHSEVRSCLVAALGAVDAESHADELSRGLAASLREHQVRLSRAEEAWQQAEQVCERSHGRKETAVASEHDACADAEKALSQVTRKLYNVCSHVAQSGPKDIRVPAKRCCADLSMAEQQLAAARAARAAAWPKVVSAVGRLEAEREGLEGTRTCLQEETRRQNLLAAEIVAPPQAKRALASMRAAMKNQEAGASLCPPNG